jgi:NAD(P)-dependent dehydrogenase (short-subunit alcohol dehydrogenase family)
MLLENKIALVTGGGSGIGRAASLALSREGAKIVISDVNIAGGEETAHLIETAGGKAAFVKADVSSSVEVQSLIQETLAVFGRLDCAINNAGISGGMMGRIHEVGDDVFDQIISVNLKGVWLCMKHELPVMLRQGGGVIVNTASVAGLLGAPKGAAYAASKHGVVGLTKSAALEYAKFNIRVNAVCPAYTDTPMVTDVIEKNPAMAHLTVIGNPMKRLGKPEEIAEGIVWLCSDAASFITGHALPLDGGMLAQ